MTTYALQRAVFDFLRAREDSRDTEGIMDRADLTPAENAALRECDISALARLGVHRVLLSGFARENGIMRDTVRQLLVDDGTDEPERTVRWRR